MSVIISRSMRWRRSGYDFHGAIRRSIARFESTVSQATTNSTKFSSEATTTAKTSVNLNRAASAVGKALGSIGGQTGQIVSFLQRHIPTTVYYVRVGLELSKLVFHGQNMVPPPMSAFQSYFQRVLEKLRNPSSILSSGPLQSPHEILERARNLNSGDLAARAVLFAELLGFFTVGEIIGRFKLIGYKGETNHHHQSK